MTTQYFHSLHNNVKIHGINRLLPKNVQISTFMAFAPSFYSGSYSNSVGSQLSQTTDTIAAQQEGQVRQLGQAPAYIANDSVQTAKSLPNLPLINGMSIAQVSQSFAPPQSSGLGGVLKNITGIDFSNPGTSLQVIEAQLGAQAALLQQEIEQEIIDCINSQLGFLSRINPVGALLYLYEFFKSAILAEISAILTALFDKYLAGLLGAKIQLGNLALLRALILQEVNLLCQAASPTAVKGYIDHPSSINNVATGSASILTSTINGRIASPASTGSVGWKGLI